MPGYVGPVPLSVELLPLAPPGSDCESDLRQVPHKIEDPNLDDDLQKVHAWLASHPLDRLLTAAVNDAVEYVLDGARTRRFDLNGPEVDSDERNTVGTILQYRVLSELKLVKEAPLDTTILGVPVELKGTVRSSWMIPREGQCEICLLVQVDAAKDRHRAVLMRAHRRWLDGPHLDKKRSIRPDALSTYGLPLLDWTSLPANPLDLLTETQRDVVFALRDGQAARLAALFGYLPEVVIPRTSILTVGTNERDTVRRTRQVKDRVLKEHGLHLLCGTRPDEWAHAQSRGFDLSGGAWVALRGQQ